ncbi:MAG: hypothetical protein WCJ26_16230 [bacterium]
MNKTPAKRDTLTTVEVIVRMISLILIPVLIWILGAWYNNQQKQIEESRITAENTANRLTYLLKNLSSDNPRERKMAVVISKYLAEKNQLPLELVQVLAVIAESDSNRDVSDAAVLSLDAAAGNGKEQAQAARAILNELPARIYIQIPDKSKMNIARRIQAMLTGQGYQVPGIEILPVTVTSNQLRYFHEGEKPDAEKIAGFLREQGQSIGILFKTGYENRVRSRQYEIWIQ